MTVTELPRRPLRAGDHGFDELCLSWNRAVTHAPALIVPAGSPEQVRDAVAEAGARGLRVRVQATGHGAIAPADGEMLIVTSAMSEVSVDAATGTALVRAGARWRDVIAAAAPYGLAPLSGSSGDVGAIGYSLGGGAGWLVRRYGLAADAVLAAQVVTADGRLRWVDAEREPELWWALRGGGPNLGVVTAVRMRLFPAANVYGGGIYWPIGRAGEVLPAYRKWTTALPPEVTTAVTLLHLPPDPAIPEPMRGRSFVRVAFCHAGPDLTGAEALAGPLRSALPDAVADLTGPLPYTAIDGISQDPVDPMPFDMWSTMLTGLTDEVLGLLSEAAADPAPAYAMLEVRHVGGGLRPDADRAGLAHWSGDFLAYSISVTPDQNAATAASAFARRMDAAFAPAATGLTPLNFLHGGRPVSAAYTPAHHRRLHEIKRRHDPDGMFGGDRALRALQAL